MISTAAIKTTDGKVWSVPRPGRHDAVFRAIAAGLSLSLCAGKDEAAPAEREKWLGYVRGHEQGFVTDEGVFLDRELAYEHAKAAGQLKPDVEGVCVEHPVHGPGSVIHVMRVPGGGCRIQVQFRREPGKSRWCGVEDLRRLLLGSILTSEDLW